MSIIAKASGGTQKELIPSGSHIARCYSMIHIGTIETTYMDETKHMDKVRLTFEVPGEMRVFNEEKGEQPMVIDKEYTLSLSEKANLRKDIDSWRGKALTEKEADEFDITKLLGVECMISVIHRTSKKGKDYATISSISRVPKGIEVPKQINPTFEFNYENHFDLEALKSLPEFIRVMIESSDEYSNRMNQLEGENLNKEMEQKVAEVDDDLPF